MTTKDFLLAAFLSLWFLLVLLLGNSFVLGYLLVVFILFYGLFSISQGKNLAKVSLGFSWILYVSLAFLLLFSTVSFSFTLENAFVVGVLYFLVVVFSYLQQKRKPVIDTFLFFLQISTVIITGLFYFFLFSPWFSNQLPVMNLVFSYSGDHHHVGTLLVLMIPTLWYSFFTTKKKVFLWLSLFLSVTTLVTFGRVLFVILLLQHFILYVLLRKKAVTADFRNSFVVYLKTIALFLIGGGIIWAVSLFRCDVDGSIFSNQLESFCRSNSGSARVAYWTQGWKVLQEYPILGSGPATYSLASKEHIVERNTYSTYVHNVFLQHFSEQGIIGGLVFVWLLFSIVRAVREKVQQKKFVPEKFIAISLLGGLLITFFDFDWNFRGILFLLFFLVSFFEITAKQKGRFEVVWRRIIFLVLLVFLSLYLLVDGLINSGRIKEAYSFFPYFHWHKPVFLEQKDFSEEEKYQLFLMHKNDYSTLTKLVVLNPLLSFREEIYSALEETYPWQRTMTNRLDEYSAAGKYTDLIEEYELIFSILDEHQSQYQEVPEFFQIKTYIKKAMAAAKQAHSEGETERAADLLNIAERFNAWSLDLYSPPFFDTDQEYNSAPQLSFSLGLLEVSPEYFGQHDRVYSQYAFDAAYNAVFQEEHSKEDIEAVLGHALLIFPDHQESVILFITYAEKTCRQYDLERNCLLAQELRETILEAEKAE